MKKIVYGILAICLIAVGCQQEDSALENIQHKKIPIDVCKNSMIYMPGNNEFILIEL